MNHSEYFYILHISKQAIWIISKKRPKKATENSILAIFLQRSVYLLTLSKSHAMYNNSEGAKFTASSVDKKK